MTAASEVMAEETVESEWNYLLFRDSVEGSDVVLQGDSGERVDGGGDSGEGSREDSCHCQSRQTRILHRKHRGFWNPNLEQYYFKVMTYHLETGALHIYKSNAVDLDEHLRW